MPRSLRTAKGRWAPEVVVDRELRVELGIGRSAHLLAICPKFDSRLPVERGESPSPAASSLKCELNPSGS